VRRVLFAVALAGLPGCGTSSSGSSPVADDGGTGAETGGVASSPAVAFVVNGQSLGDGSQALYGPRTAIQVTGLTAGATVTLSVVEKQIDAAFASRSTFVADDRGAVDTSVLAPRTAPWSGVDVDGPIWSATGPEAADAGPLLVTNGLHVDVAGTDGTVLASATLDRNFVSPQTPRTAVSDNGLVGAYYAPTDGQRHPAIIAFGGSEGGLRSGETFAAYWAARGYAALGLAYFGAPGLPQYLQQIPLEYFATAMTWVSARPEADASRIAILGGSRGGELALLLGATYPWVKAVVAYVPSGVLWGAPTGTTEVASWTLGGKDLPFVPFTGAVQYSTDTDGVSLLTEAPAFLASIQNASASIIAAATTQVDQTQGPVLMLGGADDQLWASCTLSKFAMDRLTASGHAAKYADALVCYPDDGHDISFPGLSTIGAYRVPDPYGNDDLLLGGTAAGIAHASRDADDRVAAVLQAALK
jgi:acetyl esterase/lipase